jgi:hypothetical protein
MSVGPPTRLAIDHDDMAFTEPWDSGEYDT